MVSPSVNSLNLHEAMSMCMNQNRHQVRVSENQDYETLGTFGIFGSAVVPRKLEKSRRCTNG
jgi:hypothetical protein